MLKQGLGAVELGVRRIATGHGGACAHAARSTSASETALAASRRSARAAAATATAAPESALMARPCAATICWIASITSCEWMPPARPRRARGHRERRALEHAPFDDGAQRLRGGGSR
jgi:hypothetical protein